MGPPAAKGPHSLAQRSRIVLGCADRLDSTEVAHREGVHQAMVGKWRGRSIERRL